MSHVAVTNCLMVVSQGLHSCWHIQHFCFGSAHRGKTCLVAASNTCCRWALVSVPVSEAALLNIPSASPCRSVHAMLYLSGPLAREWLMMTFSKFLCQSIHSCGVPLSKKEYSGSKFLSLLHLDGTWGQAWQNHVFSTQLQVQGSKGWLEERPWLKESWCLVPWRTHPAWSNLKGGSDITVHHAWRTGTFQCLEECWCEVK